MSLYIFNEEINNIWSEIKAIKGKFVDSRQLNESGNESSNIIEIHTLKQRNQDLLNEICILKDQLSEQNNALKSISEERDSYRTALQILTKDIHALKEKDPSPTPGLADPDPDLGSSQTQHDTRPNRGNAKSLKKSLQSINLKSKPKEPQTGRNNNEQPKRPATVTAGDPIIQNIRG